jgi:hypothetical protein
MNNIIKFFTDRKYKVIDITVSIKHHNNIVNYIKQKRNNIMLYIESNPKTKDILTTYCHGLLCDYLLIVNGQAMSIRLSEPQKTIERQLESLLNNTPDCAICLQNKDCVKCMDCCYPMCEDCICKMCDTHKDATCPQCRTNRLCDPRIYCVLCNRNWFDNPIICKTCDQTLCWVCVFKDSKFKLITYYDDTEGLEYTCSQCGSKDILMREPKGVIKKRLIF